MGQSADLQDDRSKRRHKHLPRSGNGGVKTIETLDQLKPTPISGIVYCTLPADAFLEGRDGRGVIKFNGIPIPLEEVDFQNFVDTEPDYDMVGKGVYLALRSNPDCNFNSVYASWLRDAYPHYLAELASHIVMLDRKDVEISYLDRKVNYLKIMALLEPENPGFPAEIGATLLDRGLRFSALHQSTVTLFLAETYLTKSLVLAPGVPQVLSQLAEVHYLLGRYGQAEPIWKELLPGLDVAGAQHLKARLKKVQSGQIPRVPPVDYLEAIGVAFGCYQESDFEECAAILNDILDDLAFCEEFPLPEVWYYLGLCYKNLAMPKKAAECYIEALRLDPDFAEGQSALDNLVH